MSCIKFCRFCNLPVKKILDREVCTQKSVHPQKSTWMVSHQNLIKKIKVLLSNYLPNLRHYIHKDQIRPCLCREVENVLQQFLYKALVFQYALLVQMENNFEWQLVPHTENIKKKTPIFLYSRKPNRHKTSYIWPSLDSTFF